MGIVLKKVVSRNFRTVFEKESGIFIDAAEQGWLKEIEQL